MDKNLVNHQIVSMRKVVKIARNQVVQKIFRQINQLKKKISKWENLDENVDDKLRKKHLNELNKKLQSKLNEAKKLKTIKPDQISKQALINDEKILDDLIKKSSTSMNDRLIAIVCKNRQIQMSLKKFRNENPGCEQWLPIQLELWEEKRKNKFGKNRKNSDNKSKNNSKEKKIESHQIKPNEKSEQKVSDCPKTDKTPLISPKKVQKKSPKSENISTKLKKSKRHTPTFEITKIHDEINGNEPEINVIKTKSAVIKRIDLNSVGADKIFEDNNDDNDNNDNDVNDDSKNNVDDLGNDKAKNSSYSLKDEFFLDNQNNHKIDDMGQDYIQITNKSDVDDDDDNTYKNHNYDSKKFHQSSFQKLSNNHRKFKTPQKSFSTPKRRYFDDVDNNQPQAKSEQKILHPSWQAKKKLKEKQSIFSSADKLNKHIKF